MKKKFKYICSIDGKKYTVGDFVKYISTKPKDVYIEIKNHMDDFYCEVGKHLHLAYDGMPEGDEYYTFLGRVVVDSNLEEDYKIRHKVNGMYETATIKKAED